MQKFMVTDQTTAVILNISDCLASVEKCFTIVNLQHKRKTLVF